MNSGLVDGKTMKYSEQMSQCLHNMCFQLKRPLLYSYDTSNSKYKQKNVTNLTMEKLYC